MRVVVAGLGVQGQKRRRVAGRDFVAAVDPVNSEAEYRRIEDAPLDSYDAALVCIPDEPKVAVLDYLLSRGKHVLVEKPLWAEHDREIERLATLARKNRAVCYTAYNHRFEPHFVRMRDVIKSGRLGKIHSLPHVLRQRHCSAGARLGMARPGRRRAARSRLASARHGTFLVR